MPRGHALARCVRFVAAPSAAAVEAVIDGLPGYEGFTDHEGNPLSMVLSEGEDLREMCCGDCFTLLEDEDGYEWQAMT